MHILYLSEFKDVCSDDDIEGNALPLRIIESLDAAPELLDHGRVGCCHDAVVRRCVLKIDISDSDT